MYIAKLAAIAALTTALGASAALAAAATATGADDQTGFTTLGIDISGAGRSPASVQQFLAGLAPDTQRSLLSGCQTAIANPVSYAPNVVAFCETATGNVGAGMQPLGFAPVEPSTVPSMGAGGGAAY
jgi:hypothetical protein